MQLPFRVDDQLVLDFISYWESLRTSADLPIWDIASVRQAIPALLPYVAIVEMREPRALYVRHAGESFREHYGFEISGKDLLSFTLANEVGERYRRFYEMATRPCAAVFHAPVLGSHNITILCDVIWLPVREIGTGKILLVTLHGLGGEKVYIEQTASVMPLARKFAFIDIGFGAPPPPEYPSRFAVAKAKLIQWFKLLFERPS